MVLVEQQILFAAHDLERVQVDSRKNKPTLEAVTGQEEVTKVNHGI